MFGNKIIGLFIRSNMLLNSLDGISWESQETRNKIEGQAHFLRAYFYFDLCRLFGTVPLLTTSEPENVPRATAEELYAQIAFDLKTAIEKLPSVKYGAANNSELGRATKWAAEALLARAYLFYTGYYQQESMPLLVTVLYPEPMSSRIWMIALTTVDMT